MHYRSTKTYGHDVGLSCAFRQWRAKSHCSQIHGYALAVTLTFEADSLDSCGWVMDFGGLKTVKAFLQDKFDHATLVAADDPFLSLFEQMHELGIMRIIVVRGTGCEAFAAIIANYVSVWLEAEGHSPRVRLAQVEVREHGANSAIVTVPRQ